MSRYLSGGVGTGVMVGSGVGVRTGVGVVTGVAVGVAVGTGVGLIGWKFGSPLSPAQDTRAEANSKIAPATGSDIRKGFGTTPPYRD